MKCEEADEMRESKVKMKNENGVRKLANTATHKE